MALGIWLDGEAFKSVEAVAEALLLLVSLCSVLLTEALGVVLGVVIEELLFVVSVLGVDSDVLGVEDR